MNSVENQDLYLYPTNDADLNYRVKDANSDRTILYLTLRM